MASGVAPGAGAGAAAVGVGEGGGGGAVADGGTGEGVAARVGAGPGAEGVSVGTTSGMAGAVSHAASAATNSSRKNRRISTLWIIAVRWDRSSARRTVKSPSCSIQESLHDRARPSVETLIVVVRSASNLRSCH